MKRQTLVQRVLLYVIMACALSVVPLSAVPNGAHFISLDSWLYEALDSLYLESAKVVPFTARPYTVDEYQYYLKHIESSELSESGRHTLKSIQKELVVSALYNEEYSAFSYSAIISPELYANTNKKLIWDNAYQHYLNKYAYGYTERSPILSLPIQFWGGDAFFAEVDIDIKEQPGVGLYPTSSFNQPATNAPYVNWGNIPLGFDHIYHHFPDSYYLSYSKPHWSFYLGSGEYSIGTGRTGNLILSKDADKIPAVRMSWYNKMFRYNFSYLSLNPGLSNSGTFIDEDGNVRMALDLENLTNGYNPNIYSTNLTGTDFNDYMDTGLYPYKGYLTHSMEFRFLNEKVYAAVTEAAVYARAVPELFTFMPLAFWHNTNNGEQTNSLLALDVQAAIGKYGYLYASGVLDQFTMSHESDSLDPPAYGFIVGALSRTPAGKGYITGGVEYVNTSDWLYTHKYWLQTPTVTQRNTAITRGGYTVRMLGYSEGNDYSQLHLELGYTEFGHYNLTASYNYGVKGPYDVFMRLPQKDGAGNIVRPEGDRKNWPDAIHHQVGIKGEYQLQDAFTFGMHLYYTHVTNYKHEAGNTMQNLEMSVGVRLDVGAL